MVSQGGRRGCPYELGRGVPLSRGSGREARDRVDAWDGGGRFVRAVAFDLPEGERGMAHGEVEVEVHAEPAGLGDTPVILEGDEEERGPTSPGDSEEGMKFHLTPETSNDIFGGFWENFGAESESKRPETIQESLMVMNTGAQRIMYSLGDLHKSAEVIALLTHPGFGGVLDDRERMDYIAGDDPEVPDLLSMWNSASMSYLSVYEAGKEAEGAEQGGHEAVRAFATITQHVCVKISGDPATLSRIEEQVGGIAKGGRTTMDALVKCTDVLFSMTADRLLTTVDDERVKRDLYESLKAKNEKASKDKASLEHQLKSQRKAIRKESAMLQFEEERAASAHAALVNHVVTTSDNLAADTTAERESIDKAHQHKKEVLTKEIEKLEAKFEEMAKSNKDMELLLRKKNRNETEEILNWIAEYDKEMFAKQAEVDEEKSVHDDMLAQIHKYSLAGEAMRKVREEREAVEEAARLKREKEKRLIFATQQAARVFQATWKEYKRQKEEEAKKAAKAAEKAKK